MQTPKSLKKMHTTISVWLKLEKGKDMVEC